MPPVFLEKLVLEGREYEVKTDGTFKSAVKALREVFDDRLERWDDFISDLANDDEYESEEDYDE